MRMAAFVEGAYVAVSVMEELQTYSSVAAAGIVCEPAWPSGKALGW